MPEPDFAALRNRLDAIADTPTAAATLEILARIGDAILATDDVAAADAVRDVLSFSRGFALLRVSDARPSTDPLVPARWAAQQAFAMLWTLPAETKDLAIPVFIEAADKVFADLKRTGSAVLGTIYYIRYGGQTDVKIGYATSLTARLRALGTGTPYGIELLASHPGTPADEVALHQRFAHLRISTDREWFSDGDDLMAHIKGLPQ